MSRPSAIASNSGADHSLVIGIVDVWYQEMLDDHRWSARSWVEPEALVEYRYRAVCEMLGGSPIGEVAARYGTSRQSLHSWQQRFQQEGMGGLDRGRGADV